MKEPLGKALIPTQNLKSEMDIVLEGTIKKEGSQTGLHSIKVHCKIREPIEEKQWIYESRKYCKVTKIFPAFSYDDDEEEEEVPKKKPKAKPFEDNPKLNTKLNEKNKKQVAVDKSEKAPEKKEEIGLTKDSFLPLELSDPGNIEFLISLKVLDQRIKELDMKKAKIDGRCPPEIRQQLLLAKAKKTQLENGIRDGAFEPRELIGFLEKRLQRDECLYMYFKENNMKDKEMIVAQRLPILKEEIREGLAYINKSG